MKVLFVHPNTKTHPIYISLGLAYVAGVLRQKGIEIDLLDTTFSEKKEEIISKALAFRPDLVAFSVVSNNYKKAVWVANVLKGHLRVPFLCGGIHPTSSPEETLSEPAFDMICLGEGEYTIGCLVDSMSNGEDNFLIDGLWFKKEGKIVKNPVAHLIEDLDSLPFPYRELFDYQTYLKWHNNVSSIFTSRGCPHKCGYCFNHKMHKIYEGKGKWVRYRGIENVLAEMRELLSNYSVQRFEITDDTFILNKKRTIEFCKQYKREIGIGYHVNARLDLIDEEICRELNDSGCKRVMVGLEAGDERIRNDVLKRGMSEKTILEGCRIIKSSGIELFTNNMIGLPFENEDTIRKTLELNKQAQPDYMQIAIFNAYPGTDMYEVCKKNNWLSEKEIVYSYRASTNVMLPDITLKELIKFRDLFGFRVYFKTNLIKALIYLIDGKVGKHPSLIPVFEHFRSTALRFYRHFYDRRKNRK